MVTKWYSVEGGGGPLQTGIEDKHMEGFGGETLKTQATFKI
jgi:hypothetical protein